MRAAIAGGYGIEIDLQVAACGEAMVFHDATLRRLTGHIGQVAELDAAALSAIPLAGAADGETIPTLPDILALVAGQVPLLIEIKDPDATLGPGSGVLEGRVAECLADYAGPVAVMSFNPHSVMALSRLAPGVARGLTTCDFVGATWPLPDYRRAELAGISDFEATGSSFVSHNRTELDNPALARLKARGVPILCWTVRSPAQERIARRVADNVTFEGYAALAGS